MSVLVAPYAQGLSIHWSQSNSRSRPRIVCAAGSSSDPVAETAFRKAPLENQWKCWWSAGCRADPAPQCTAKILCTALPSSQLKETTSHSRADMPFSTLEFVGLKLEIACRILLLYSWCWQHLCNLLMPVVQDQHLQAAYEAHSNCMGCTGQWSQVGSDSLRGGTGKRARFRHRPLLLPLPKTRYCNCWLHDRAAHTQECAC